MNLWWGLTPQYHSDSFFLICMQQLTAFIKLIQIVTQLVCSWITFLNNSWTIVGTYIKFAILIEWPCEFFSDITYMTFDINVDLNFKLCVFFYEISFMYYMWDLVNYPGWVKRFRPAVWWIPIFLGKHGLFWSSKFCFFKVS